MEGQVEQTPDNQCGKRALKLFNLTALSRPHTYVVNDFEILDEVVVDRVTGLTWQKTGSPYQLNWQDAHEYIATLNRECSAGLNSWRLPTIDELVTLLNQHSDENKTPFDPKRKWLWSCDLHGKMERWFVNLDMGYVSSQDMDCPNYVKAVSSEMM